LRPRIAPGLLLSESDILKKTNSGKRKCQVKTTLVEKRWDHQQHMAKITTAAEVRPTVSKEKGNAKL